MFYDFIMISLKTHRKLCLSNEICLLSISYVIAGYHF